MKTVIDRLLERFGLDATVNGNPVRIFFQFSNSKSWDSMNPIITPVGQIPGGQYLYIGPAEVEIAAGDELRVNNTPYIMRRCEVYQTQEGPIYRWALCALKGKEVKWGYRP